MSQWFRMYAAVRNDPKVQRLPDPVFKAWVNILCLAAEQEGRLPSIKDIAFDLRLPEAKTRKVIETLQEAGLIDVSDEGMEPHNWRSRQYKSDVSTTRVKRFRERSKKHEEAVIETPAETPPEQSRAETEQRERETRGCMTLHRGWIPKAETLQWVALKNIEDARRDAMIEHFTEHHLGKGTTFADPDAAFRTWVIRNPQFVGRTDESGGTKRGRRSDNGFATAVGEVLAGSALRGSHDT